MSNFDFFFSSLLIVYEGQHMESVRDHKNSQGSRCFSLDSDFTSDFEDSLDESLDAFKPSSNVSVKIIDFANCTFEGFLDDPIVHRGPDRGFIKGLDSLIKILQKSLCLESL